jgi:Tol biopolymer transport system component
MQLTASAGDSITPRISNNGAYVIFASAADLGAGPNDDARLEVYVVSTDGTGLTRITDTDQDSGLRFNGSAPAVDISGDGNWITFMSYADLNGINTNNTYTVYWANRDGTTIQQLLRLETKPDGVNNRAAEVPRMSDDGSQILFNALTPYSESAPDSGWKIFLHSRI